MRITNRIPIKLKIASWIIKSKGFLTKKGALLDYSELHSLGLGIIDGLTHKSQDYHKVVQRTLVRNKDVDKETHYYRIGYFLSNRAKYLLSFYIYLQVF